MSQQTPARAADGRDLPATDERWVTRAEIARVNRVSVKTIDRLVAANRIPSRKFGHRRLFPMAAAEAEA